MKGPQRVTTDYGHSIYTSHGSQHGIMAHHDDGTEIGKLVWNNRRIGNVEVKPEFQRQGIATGMLEHARLLAELNTRIPQPKHSNDRTTAGDAWARSVGGPLPRRRDL
jgi:GNAT superfamily N-acetyltransferase